MHCGKIVVDMQGKEWHDEDYERCGEKEDDERVNRKGEREL